jgi:hypothetical protein
MDNPITDKHGTRRWLDSNGKLHRDDGPAVIYADGTKEWFQHGRYHRDDGPAIDEADGDKEWWQHGRRHRDDGPAIEWDDNQNYWFLRDKYLSFNNWLDKVDMSDEAKVMMTLKYG